MGKPDVSYAQLPDITPDAQLGVLESIYALAVKRFEEEQRGGPAKSRPDDAKRRSNEIGAKRSIPR